MTTPTSTFLVRFEATNLSQYILDTDDLSVIRGASSQLDDVVDDLAKVAATIGATLVYGGASEALFSVASETQAKTAIEILQKLMTTKCNYATGVTGYEQWKDEPLRDCLTRLQTKLRREQLRRPTVIPPSSPHGQKACEIDGVRPAQTIIEKHPKGRREASAHTEQRWRKGRQLRTGYLKRIFGEDRIKRIETRDWEQSFEGFAKVSAAASSVSGSVKLPIESKMCVIHADGNKFGDCRNQIDSIEGLRAFSKLVETAMNATLAAALTELLTLGESVGVLPFHLLYRAGDELSLVLPARFGCAVIEKLLSEFSRHTTPQKAEPDELVLLWGKIGPKSLTLAVGAVFCDTHEPIQRAHDLARALVERAKGFIGDARDPASANVIEHAVIESGFVPADLSEYIGRTRSCVWKRSPSGPAGVLRDAPLTRDDFSRLTKDIERLKIANFPTTRMHAFAAAVRDASDTTNVVDQCWVLFKGIPEDIKVPSDLIPASRAACTTDGRHVRDWLDRRALWDYVPKPSTDSQTAPAPDRTTMPMNQEGR